MTPRVPFPCALQREEPPPADVVYADPARATTDYSGAFRSGSGARNVLEQTAPPLTPPVTQAKAQTVHSSAQRRGSGVYGEYRRLCVTAKAGCAVFIKTADPRLY